MDTLDTLYCRQVSRVPFAGSIVTNGTNGVNWDKRSKKLNKHTLHILAPWQPWPSSLSLQRWSPWCFAQATAFYLNRIGLYLPLVRLQIERWCCRWFDPSTSLINLILSRFRKCFIFFCWFPCCDGYLLPVFFVEFLNDRTSRNSHPSSRSGLHFLEREIGISPWSLAVALLPFPTI